MQKLRRIFEYLPKLKRKKLSREHKINLIVTIMICLFLLTLSVSMKNYFSQLYWREHGMGYGWGFNWTHYNTTVVTFENGTVVTYGNISEITKIWFIEAYSDASHYYGPYLDSFRFKNWNPYSGGTYEDDPLHGYAYGPMFIYGLYFISLLVSIFNPNMSRLTLVSKSVKWTHIIFDSFSVILLYLIIISLRSFRDKRIKKHSFGLLGATIFLFVPINLLYVDCLYLNTPQMAFFTLLSFLFLIKEKYRTSAFFLAIAWLSKQMSLFLLIPWFFIIWKKKSLKESLLDFLFPFLVTTFLLSLPWLFISPFSYVWRVFGPGKPLASVNLAFIDRTVTFAHSFEFLGMSDVANAYVIINNYMIPFLLFYAVAVLISYFKGNKIGNDESVLVIFTTCVLINTHLFISRGVYKYYNAFLTPFVILSLLVFLDSQISAIVGEKVRINGNSEIKIDENEKEKPIPLNYNRSLLNNILLFVTFVILCAVFYYWNWVLIVRNRNLHPLFLLALFGCISVLLPPELYKSLIEKNSYKMLKEDIVYIYRQSILKIKKVNKRIESMFKKKKT